MKKTFFSLICLLLILTGCGYKPTSYYAKNEISGNVFVKLLVRSRMSEAGSIVTSDIRHRTSICKY